CRANRRYTGRQPTAERSARKDFARAAAQRSIRPRLAMIQRLTTSGSAHCANAMNWCRADNYLFAHNRPGSTASIRSQNLTRCRRGEDRRTLLLMATLNGRSPDQLWPRPRQWHRATDVSDGDMGFWLGQRNR